MPDLVDEGSDSEEVYRFTDLSGTLVANVESVEYKVSNAQKTVLVPWTTLAPAAEGTIAIGAAVNTKANINDILRFVTVRITYNSGKVRTAEKSYRLVDLLGV